jgi:hypothetical protein
MMRVHGGMRVVPMAGFERVTVLCVCQCIRNMAFGGKGYTHV